MTTGTGNDTGDRDGGFIYLTRRVRIPVDKVVAIRPAAGGDESIVITDRGATRICEPYEQVVSAYEAGLAGGKGAR